MNVAVAFVCGALFAVGLVVAGMTQPSKVVGFLDVGGRWDLSLAMVMVGAIGVFLPVYRLSRRRERPYLGAIFSAPTERMIDTRLVTGAAVFGIGWGASGYCPGPAIASLGRGGAGLLVFAGAMIIGMMGVEWTRSRR